VTCGNLRLVAVPIEPPDLPGLVRLPLLKASDDGELALEGVLVDHADAEPVDARRVRIMESELRGLRLRAEDARGIRLRDVVLRDCDLSNVHGQEGSVRRVQILGSRLMGFDLAGGDVHDLIVEDSSLALASFAFAKLRNVIFERVDLIEASFMEAQLDAVEFVDCKLSSADFRGVKTKDCAIRGSSLDGVLGVDCLNGVAMPWADVLGSAGALAGALGIVVEFD
jgi:uncharacterized protein YjbI with pentapeptide repeats